MIQELQTTIDDQVEAPMPSNVSEEVTEMYWLVKSTTNISERYFMHNCIVDLK